jgi:REP element-mobilizing transposase RayT
MDIEIKPHSKIKDSLDRFHSRIEDLMYDMILKIPERFIPASLMNWLDTYTTKRINQLRQQTIKQTWHNMYLQKASQEISAKQAQKKHQ